MRPAVTVTGQRQNSSVANSTTFWNTIYSYTASATAGNFSYGCARGRHRTVSAAASRRHVDASLDLFARKSPRSLRIFLIIHGDLTCFQKAHGQAADHQI